MQEKTDFNQEEFNEELNIVQTSFQAVRGRKELFLRLLSIFRIPLRFLHGMGLRLWSIGPCWLNLEFKTKI
ncbi:MAG TPA: hypothetical protein GXX46_06040 [Peptococcaceae bacterium]|nr:hypothetical protein [Peptococcaceae bacterium]